MTRANEFEYKNGDKRRRKREAEEKRERDRETEEKKVIVPCHFVSLMGISQKEQHARRKIRERRTTYVIRARI